MARIIKLKESDITNIVKRIINEEKGKKKKPTSMRELGKKPSKKEIKSFVKKELSGSAEQVVGKYKKLYSGCPRFVQSECLSPSEFKKAILENDDDGPQGYSIIISILCWALVAWYMWATW
tara:strand:+ start:70 stop:432 length:363 start_codon:yes stop_codon:yes gene_type:complete